MILRGKTKKRMYRDLSADELKQIIEMIYKRGYLNKEVSEQFRISQGIVTKILKLHKEDPTYIEKKRDTLDDTLIRLEALKQVVERMKKRDKVIKSVASVKSNLLKESGFEMTTGEIRDFLHGYLHFRYKKVLFQ